MNLLDEFDKEELRLLNANLLPLKKLKWEFTRGMRTVQKYVDELGNVNIKEEYNYTMSSDNRDVIDFTRSMQWLLDDGTIILEVDTTPDKDSIIIEEINEAIRERRIRYLKTATKQLRAGADALPSVVDQATVDYLISQGHVHPAYNTTTLYGQFRQGLIDAADGLSYTLHLFRNEIIEYEKDNADTFETALDSTQDIIVLGILNSTLRPPDSIFPNGLTGRQSIDFQFNGVIP